MTNIFVTKDIEQVIPYHRYPNDVRNGYYQTDHPDYNWFASEEIIVKFRSLPIEYDVHKRIHGRVHI